MDSKHVGGGIYARAQGVDSVLLFEDLAVVNNSAAGDGMLLVICFFF